MTDFERAKIYLEAFQLLNGWSMEQSDENGKKKYVPWTLKQRKQHAAELAEWAIAAEPSQDDSNVTKT